jgi:hypothetical protein
LRIRRGRHIATQTTWITLRRSMLIAIESCMSYLVLLAFLILTYTVSSVSFFVALGIVSIIFFFLPPRAHLLTVPFRSVHSSASISARQCCFQPAIPYSKRTDLIRPLTCGICRWRPCDLSLSPSTTQAAATLRFDRRSGLSSASQRTGTRSNCRLTSCRTA